METSRPEASLEVTRNADTWDLNPFHEYVIRMSARASTAKLALDEDTIGRAKGREQPNGSILIEWSYRPSDGGKVLRRKSQGKTISEARLRAHEKLDELKAAIAGAGSWKPNSSMANYIDKVSRQMIAKADLAPLSVTRYEIALKLILGDCSEHRHRHSFKNHTIASGTRFAALEDLLTEIAKLHGRETARQARTVLNKYVLTRLIRDGLLDGNPITGVALDQLTGIRKGERVRGGKALTPSEYDKVLDHLLGIDPADDVEPPIRGRWTLEHRIAKRRNAIDQLLLQATTGLRSSEANLITWKHVGINSDGEIHLNITREVAKGGIPRVTIVLDPRVAERLKERQSRAASPREYVIGAPSDPNKVWERRNRNKTASELYNEIAKELEIELLEHERSHVWRTTLHALYEGLAPTAVINAQFGHSEKTHARFYTDPSDLSPLREAARRR